MDRREHKITLTQFQTSPYAISCSSRAGWNVRCWMSVAEEGFHCVGDRERK